MGTLKTKPTFVFALGFACAFLISVSSAEASCGWNGPNNTGQVQCNFWDSASSAQTVCNLKYGTTTASGVTSPNYIATLSNGSSSTYNCVQNTQAALVPSAITVSGNGNCVQVGTFIDSSGNTMTCNGVGQAPVKSEGGSPSSGAGSGSLKKPTTTTPGSTAPGATTGTPAAGTPAAGTPAAGTPAAGTPAAGTPAAGTPAAGAPAAGAPAAAKNNPVVDQAGQDQSVSAIDTNEAIASKNPPSTASLPQQDPTFSLGTGGQDGTVTLGTVGGQQVGTGDVTGVSGVGSQVGGGYINIPSATKGNGQDQISMSPSGVLTATGVDPTTGNTVNLLPPSVDPNAPLSTSGQIQLKDGTVLNTEAGTGTSPPSVSYTAPNGDGTFTATTNGAAADQGGKITTVTADGGVQTGVQTAANPNGTAPTLASQTGTQNPTPAITDKAPDGGSVADGTSDSLCPKSANISNGEFKNCDSTSKLMSASTITTTVGQIAGSTTLSAEGQSASSNLQANGGSQSQAYMASAKLSQDASEAQLAIGGTQMIMGYLENSASGKHKTAAQQLAAAAQPTTYTKGAVTAPSSAGLSQTTTTINIKDKYASSAISQYGDTQGATDITVNAAKDAGNAQVIAMGTNSKLVLSASGKLAAAAANQGITEQNGMAQKASAQGFTDMLTGGKTLVSGILAYAAAKQAEKAAAEMTTSVSAQPPAADPFNTTPIVASAPTAITGGTTATTTPTTTSADAPTGAIGSGGGDGSTDGSSVAGPAAAPFTPGVGSGGSGGGLTGGGGGSTATSPATAASDAEPTAKYADNRSATASYEGSGATGGGAKTGGADTGALSLKDAFAALMNPEGQKKDDSGVDIMAFRKLASDETYAPLGSSDDFFTYIHTAYQGLQKKGRIGL